MQQQRWVEFKVAFEQAIAHPEAANLAQLWCEVEQRLALLERDEQLRAAGEAIAQLAEIYCSRAKRLLDSWDQRWSDRAQTEPVLTEEMLAGFLRQTMSLNLEGVLDDYIQTRNRTASEDSVAAEVEKQAVLEWLEQEEKDRVLAIAHDENVGQWIALVQSWLAAHQQQGTFRAIVHDLQQQDATLTSITIWLALLLGGFQLQQCEESFYGFDCLVKR